LLPDAAERTLRPDKDKPNEALGECLLHPLHRNDPMTVQIAQKGRGKGA